MKVLLLVIATSALLVALTTASGRMTYVPKIVTSFTYEDRSFGVFAAVDNNPDRPEAMQFAYEPLLIPALIDDVSNRKLVVKGPYKAAHGYFQLHVVMQLHNNKARRQAFLALKQLYPKVQEQNVNMFPVQRITASLTNVRDLPDNVRLKDQPLLEGTASATAPLIFESTDVGALTSFQSQMESVFVIFDVQYEAKESQTNLKFISASLLSQTKLSALLNGQSDKTVQVHRDDAIESLVNAGQSINFRTVIEDPSAGFAADEVLPSLQALIIKWFDQGGQNMVAFDQNSMSTSTFNSADLNPDVLSRELQKAFTWDQATKSVKLSASALSDLKTQNYKSSDVQTAGDYQAGGGFPLGFGMNAKVSTNSHVNRLAYATYANRQESAMSQDEFENILSNRNIESDLSGTLIKVKSVKVRRLNSGDFSNGISLTIARTIVNGNGSFPLQYQVQLVAPDVLAPPPPPPPSKEDPATGVPPATAVNTHSCKKIKATGGSKGSAVYTITPTDDGTSYSVWCDMDTDGGGWTLVYKTDRSSTAERTEVGVNIAALSSKEVDAVAMLPRFAIEQLGSTYRFVSADQIPRLYWRGKAAFYTTDNHKPGGTDGTLQGKLHWNDAWGTACLAKFAKHGPCISLESADTCASNAANPHICTQRFCCGGLANGVWINGGLYAPGVYLGGSIWVQ